jgi:hypothetical protein
MKKLIYTLFIIAVMISTACDTDLEDEMGGVKVYFTNNVSVVVREIKWYADFGGTGVPCQVWKGEYPRNSSTAAKEVCSTNGRAIAFDDSGNKILLLTYKDFEYIVLPVSIGYSDTYHYNIDAYTDSLDTINDCDNVLGCFYNF